MTTRNPIWFAGLLAYSTTANAADPSLIIGKWIEKFSNGSGMVTEFSPSAIAAYPVDQSGEPISPPKPMTVIYRDIDQGSIGIEFQGGGGIMVMVKDADTIMLDFPGLAARQLKKLRP